MRYRMIAAMLLATIASAVLACGAAADSADAPGVASPQVTIDFSTYGAGKVFNPLFYRSDGLVFPPLRCGLAGCDSWFVGFVQGDDALVQTPLLGPIEATFTRPVADLSLSVAPALQGTATYTLTAFGASGEVVGRTSITVTQDTGDPTSGPSGYFTISLDALASPGKSFTLNNTFVRSSFGHNAMEYGVSSITYTHWGEQPSV